ncbi:MAG: hypothetical protein ACFFCV_20885 [Promethearchaeota archaeon]
MITIKKKQEIIFLACCDSNAKEVKVNEELDLVSKRFLDIYPKVLIEDFEGDRSVFSNSEKRFLSEIKYIID